MVEFEEFCARQKTTPYTSQKNGVAERMNKTLMERARSMLSGAGLGQEFWAKAVQTACYLVNRSPSSSLEDKTPQEVWNCKKPSLSHLRVFGCDAYVQVPKEKRTKLDSKSKKFIFVGNVREAGDSEDGKLSKEAMVDEMASLHKNESWDLVELSTGRKPIGNKWVFKKKTNAEGKVEKYKALLVAKGYSQVPRIDFGDIFSPVTKVTSIRLRLSLAASFDFGVEQMDGKKTFLHGDLEEEIYMKQLEGFVVKGKKELACKLNKSLYGLKQSPRMWYQKFDTFIWGLGFTRSKEDHCVYFKLIGDHVIYMVLYLDDMLLVGNEKEIIQDLKT
eukprot:PITA_29027